MLILKALLSLSRYQMGSPLGKLLDPGTCVQTWRREIHRQPIYYDIYNYYNYIAEVVNSLKCCRVCARECMVQQLTPVPSLPCRQAWGRHCWRALWTPHQQGESVTNQTCTSNLSSLLLIPICILTHLKQPGAIFIVSCLFYYEGEIYN